MSRERHRARNVLVVAQVAMALVLLVSAGLMIRTFQALRTVEPGFTHAEHLADDADLDSGFLIAEPQRVTRIQNDIARQAGGDSGRDFGWVRERDAYGRDRAQLGFDLCRGQELSAAKSRLSGCSRYVSPGFFHTAGTRMVAGREFTWTEVYGLRPVVMVSENLARELWGTPSPRVGKRFASFRNAWQEVIGVVEDVRENGVHEKAPAIVYWPSMTDDIFGPHTVDAARTVTFVVRSDRAGTEGFLNESGKPSGR